MTNIIRKAIVIFSLTAVTNFSFAQTSKNDSITSEGYKLNLEYNVMNNITLDNPRRYKNKKRYKFIEKGVYLDLKEKDVFKYRMSISYVLESDKTNNQYPLEDILDKYLLFVSHEFGKKKNMFKIELGGDLDDIIKAKNEIIGRKIFNRDSIGEDKKIYVNLVIE
ncbi:hypothetical protein [uncultured Psychroserpens sp.]|uniref:hypothetical protein n=1 Tax=uncultured Psychroserpens sp. TaxID=255436 RepID=UPI002616A8C9|nr:hypothetical protein [uncultured Psychroserpens sp.]